MRVLVQEVLQASVHIDNEEVASIGRGFLLFTGFCLTDEETVLPKMRDKIAKLRIFPDENGKTNRSLADVGGGILSVSQFTLYASSKDGNRPSFTACMDAGKARILFEKWNSLLKEAFPNLRTGVFQADMKVSLTNDGPFTLWLDSQELWRM